MGHALGLAPDSFRLSQEKILVLKVQRMKLLLRLTLLFSLISLALSYTVPRDPRQLTKRSPQDAPPAEGDDAEKPPVWCSFSLPWRGVSGLVDKRCQELAGAGASR